MTSLAGFVLAAGLGTRIAALSRLRPKPLLPIGLSTSFDRAVDALRAGGAVRVVANASHLAEQVVARGRARDVDVVVEEGGPHGTAGGLAGVRDRLNADAIAIWNGDIVASIDVASLASAMRARGAVAALAVRGDEQVGRGNVGLDRDGGVVRLRDRSFGVEARGAWFAAVHVLDRSLAAEAPSRGCLVGDLLIPALGRGALIVAHATTGPWHDVGDVPSYLAANLAEAPARGEGAVIDPAVRVDRSIVGRDARVSGSGALSRCVVWPGARATAPLSSSIVTSAGDVVLVEGVDAVA